MIQPILVIITIIMILLMAAVAMLASILAAKEKNPLNSSMRNFSMLLLGYLFFAFLQYYCQENSYSVTSMKVLGCFADVCYFIFVAYWVKILMEFSENTEIINPKTLWVVTLLYGFVSEAIVLLKGQYGALTGIFSIKDPIYVAILVIINGAYGIWILIGSGRYFAFAHKNLPMGRKKNGVFFLVDSYVFI